MERQCKSNGLDMHRRYVLSCRSSSAMIRTEHAMRLGRKASRIYTHSRQPAALRYTRLRAYQTFVLQGAFGSFSIGDCSNRPDLRTLRRNAQCFVQYTAAASSAYTPAITPFPAVHMMLRASKCLMLRSSASHESGQWRAEVVAVHDTELQGALQ